MNINLVLKKDLCMGCGVCASVCPKECISMSSNNLGYIKPKIDEQKCINCEKCLKVCSGYEWSNKEVNEFYFNKKQENFNVGIYEKCYIGYSNNRKLRLNGASGGIVTTILIYLLNKEMINGAVVTVMDNESKTFGKMIIAKTEEDIINAAKSKYTPVHAGEVLKQIKNIDGRYAFVGLPCHIQSLRKAQMTDKSLIKKIPYCIGILCGGGVSNKPTCLEIDKNGIKKENVKEFQYRAEGWSPFKVGLTLNSGEKIVKEYIKTYFGLMFNNHITSPKRCELCYDLFAESADISCGDAWLREYNGNKEGYSIVIARNDKSTNIINNMKEENELNIYETDIKKVEESQIGQILYKKQKIFTRMMFYKSKPTYSHIKREKVDLKYLFVYILYKIADRSVNNAIKNNTLKNKSELYFKIIRKLTSYQFY